MIPYIEDNLMSHPFAAQAVGAQWNPNTTLNVNVVGNRASPLAAFVERQHQIAMTIGELTTRLHKQCDALLGGAPPVPGNTQANPIRDGALGQMADALDATDNVLGWLRSVVERVESL